MAAVQPLVIKYLLLCKQEILFLPQFGKTLLAAPRAGPHAPAGQLHHDRKQPRDRDQPIQLPHRRKYTALQFILSLAPEPLKFCRNHYVSS